MAALCLECMISPPKELVVSSFTRWRTWQPLWLIPCSFFDQSPNATLCPALPVEVDFGCSCGIFGKLGGLEGSRIVSAREKTYHFPSPIQKMPYHNLAFHAPLFMISRMLYYTGDCRGPELSGSSSTVIFLSVLTRPGRTACPLLF